VSFDVEIRNIAGQVTAVGAAGPFTLVVDRPIEAGGGGLGFNGGQLRIALDRVVVRVTGDFTGSPAISTDVGYEVEISGDAPPETLRELVGRVDRTAEISNSLRSGTSVELRAIHISD
jgi:putative redox protein